MIDLIATQPQYAAHLDPVWDALPARVRGERQGVKPMPSTDAVIVAAHQDLARARKAGYRRIAYLEHGIGQAYGNRHWAYPGGKDRDGVDLFLSPNATAATMDRAAYPDARVEVVGDPRLDTLPARIPDGRTTVAISFHWASTYVSRHEGRPALHHYRKALPELAAAVNLIGHAHPRAADQMARLYGKLGIEFVADFDDVCRRADLYVCDNSSTIFEFASTGRPVVLLDAPWFRRDVEIGLRFWSAADVGLHASGPADVVDVVKLALEDQHRRRREAALSIAYGHRGGAGARAARLITRWLGNRQAVAA